MAGAGAADLGRDLRAGFGNSFGAALDAAFFRAVFDTVRFVFFTDEDRAARLSGAFFPVFALLAGFARALVFFARLTLDFRAAAWTTAFLDADFCVLAFLRFALDAMLALPVMDSG